MTGAHVITHNDISQLLLGVFVLAALVLVLPVDRKFSIKKEAIPLVCTAGFLLASMLVAAIFRCNLPDIAFNSSRYLLYPNFLAAIVFIFFVYKIQAKRYLTLATVMCITLFLVCYKLNFNDGKGAFDGMKDVLLKNQYHYHNLEEAKRIAEQACAQKIYCIEQHRQGK